jgi:hypothetical protein
VRFSPAPCLVLLLLSSTSFPVSVLSRAPRQVQEQRDTYHRELKGLRAELEQEREALKNSRAEIARLRLGQVPFTKSTRLFLLLSSAPL